MYEYLQLHARTFLMYARYLGIRQLTGQDYPFDTYTLKSADPGCIMDSHLGTGVDLKSWQ
jgi:hypothetical protein